jgi:hypothetical protein
MSKTVGAVTIEEHGVRSAVPQLMVGGGEAGRKTLEKRGPMRRGCQEDGNRAFSKRSKGPRNAQRGGNPQDSRGGQVGVAWRGRFRGTSTGGRLESTVAGTWSHYGPRARGFPRPPRRRVLANAA